MAFPSSSPFAADGLSKFWLLTQHRMTEWAVYAFVDLNLADRLVHAKPDRGLTVEEIIGDDQSKWNKDYLYRLLRPCIDAGIVKRVNDDQHFVLTESGLLLTSDHPSHMCDYIKFVLGPDSSRLTERIADVVRGEGPSACSLVWGVDLYTWLSRPEQKEQTDIFNGAMTALTEYTADKLVSAVDFGRFQTLVDLGGNRGTLLAHILHRYPPIKQGMIFDLPPVINNVKHGEDFQSHKISADRYEFITGDMFDSSTIPQADAYILKRILHNNSDEKVIKILSSIRRANQNSTGKTVTVFIIENVILADGTVSNWQSHGLDMFMLAHYGNAKERTKEEYKQLLEQSGFQFKQLYPTQAPDSIIEAVAKN